VGWVSAGDEVSSDYSTDLDDAEAQHGRGNVADPHACEHCYAHAGEEDGSGFCSCFGKDECGHHFGNVVFAQRGGDCETSE
jgi:hypothetical protein